MNLPILEFLFQCYFLYKRHTHFSTLSVYTVIFNPIIITWYTLYTTINCTPFYMNLWGFNESFIKEANDRFPAFLDDAMINNPMKGEYFLPSVVSQLLAEGKATVKVLKSPDKWYGVTYREDKPGIIKALADKATAGFYPVPLWQ